MTVMQWSDRVARRLKLRDLHILLAVAESGSMGKAATDFAISQPSVSKAIADVAHPLGLRLFDRERRCTSTPTWQSLRSCPHLLDRRGGNAVSPVPLRDPSNRNARVTRN